jgi:hypothetical protein
MKTILMHVTPAIAREWLKSNTENRPLRTSHVEALRAAFERGEYKPTHQGVAFDVRGVVLDGQHRLHAIALINDPDASFPMLVTRGLERETFNVIDTGASVRKVSDVLRIHPQTGVVATFFAQLMLTRQKARPTPQQVQPFVELVSSSVDRLMSFCPTAAKTWSAAPVKAAVVVSIKRGYGDYALLMYRALVLAKFDEMPPISQALYRSHMAGSVRAAGGRDMFVRCLKVFEPSNAKLSRVQIKDASVETEAVRAQVAQWMGEAPKKKAAPVTRAAKSVQGEYRTAA